MNDQVVLLLVAVEMGRMNGVEMLLSACVGAGVGGGCDICYKSLLKCNWAGGEKEMRDLVR